MSNDVEDQMSVKVGINGFGRIGRLFVRAVKRTGAEVDIVGINDIMDGATMRHLFKYDSVHGVYPGEVRFEGDRLVVDDEEIRVTSERDPAQLPWRELGAEGGDEAHGLFTKRGGDRRDLEGGAKKVIISAPAKGPDATICLGVNFDAYDKETMHVISNASCTTNCLAPMAKVLHAEFGIVRGFMTTIHAYTNDQKIL